MGYHNHRLTVIKGFNKGEVFPLQEDRIVIGRGEDNEIVLNIAEISREHALLTKQVDSYILKDLNSTNGTFVDKKRIGGKYLLKPGDTIMLGDAVYLTYEADADPDATLVSPMPEAVQDPASTAVTPRREPVRAPAAPPPQPAAVGRIQEEQLTMEGGRKTWLWAGLGCLVVIIFLAVVGLIAFDYLNLYCTPPFDTLLNFLYTCPS